jgi:hypothetical protein
MKRETKKKTRLVPNVKKRRKKHKNNLMIGSASFTYNPVYKKDTLFLSLSKRPILGKLAIQIPVDSTSVLHSLPDI